MPWRLRSPQRHVAPPTWPCSPPPLLQLQALATAAAEQGFSFHHVPLDADGRCVVLKRWLQPLLEDKIPPFATHQVGIAGLCIDNAGRLLVVKEWSDVEGGGREPSKQWKLPVS